MTSQKTLNLNLNLQPGESVTVDAEQYYVTYQNGVDATDSASGDWLDDLSRKTREISIGYNRSAISTKIEYSERYL